MSTAFLTAPLIELQPIPAATIGTFSGVRLPRSVPFFDCRWPDDLPQPKNDAGFTMWGCERAAYAMGLRDGTHRQNDCTPVGCQAYTDFRKCAYGTLGKTIADMRRAVAQQWKRYRQDRKYPAAKGEGGGITYPPAAIALANYGWSLIADQRRGVVVSFASQRKGGAK